MIAVAFEISTIHFSSQILLSSLESSSLVPRLFPLPVFDCLQYANTKAKRSNTGMEVGMAWERG